MLVAVNATTGAGWGSLTPTETRRRAVGQRGVINKGHCKRLSSRRALCKPHLTHVYAKPSGLPVQLVDEAARRSPVTILAARLIAGTVIGTSR